MRKSIAMITLVVLAFSALLSSCSKYPGFTKDDSGFYYKFYVQNKDSVKADTNHILTMKIRYRVNMNGKDSVFFDSKEMAKPFQLNLMKPQFKGDVYQAFAMLHQGDSASFILNARDFFTKTAQYPSVPAGIDSTTMIFFDVKVLKIESVEKLRKEAEEKAARLKSEEASVLQKFIAAKGITAAPSETGVYYVEEKPGSGSLVKKGDFIKIDFTVYTIDEKKVFSTLDTKQPISLEFGQPFDTKGLDEGLAKMKLGTKARIIVPSAMGFGERGRKDMNGTEIIAPYSPVIYDVEIISIQSKAAHEKEMAAKDAKEKAEAKAAEAKEPSLIQKYMAEKKITAKPTASGLYYIERVKGKGPRAVKGKKVSVHYTGRLLDGTVFDSSLERKPAKPYEFLLGNGSVIQGWDEGIALMNQGGKATLIVPSKLGYGSSGNGQVIKPFSPLVFDVELVNVSDK